METDKITESTSTHVIVQSTLLRVGIMGIVNLTTPQYYSYLKRIERLNRKVNGEIPSIQMGLIPVEELNTQTLDSVLQASEEIKSYNCIFGKMEYPNLEEKAKEELEKIEEDLFEMDRKVRE